MHGSRKNAVTYLFAVDSALDLLETIREGNQNDGRDAPHIFRAVLRHTGWCAECACLILIIFLIRQVRSAAIDSLRFR